MEKVAWRGIVRVILPRTVVPTSGRSGPVGRVMQRVDAFEVFEVEGSERIGPAMLA